VGGDLSGRHGLLAALPVTDFCLLSASSGSCLSYSLDNRMRQGSILLFRACASRRTICDLTDSGPHGLRTCHCYSDVREYLVKLALFYDIGKPIVIDALFDITEVTSYSQSIPRILVCGRRFM